MKRMLLIVALIIFGITPAMANESGENGAFSLAFLEIAIMLILARIASSIAEKIGQPEVLGELLVGILLGNIGLIGLHFFDVITTDQSISFLKELGVVILLFQVGLESNVKEMAKVGVKATLVAIIGVAVPFFLGTWVVGPWLLPGLPLGTYLFLGAALTATSVGITARVFKDLKKTDSQEARIVLGAAVIDDVLGLIVLAVVSGIVRNGTANFASIGWISVKATLFLFAAITLGQLMAKQLNYLFSKIHDGHGMKFTVAICFCLGFAFISELIGLAPIVGAFAAGLVLDPVHFKRFRRPDIVQRIDDYINGEDEEKEYDSAFREKITQLTKTHTEEHVERLMRPLGYFLIPLFFVMTGVGVKLSVLFNPSIIITALAITVVAFAGKIVAGIAAGKGINKLIVGIGMIARGEVGLIFVIKGQDLGVVTPDVYAIIVCVIVFSTLFTPIALNYMLKKQKS